MKKNLTFLMMLMAFVGVLSAQSGPKFNYQAVVRHHITEYQGEQVDMDTLYHNNPVNIEIRILSSEEVEMYSEHHNGIVTSDNGFVSVVIGEGSDKSGNLSLVNWEGAMIDVTFTLLAANNTEVSSIMNVQPVPFALQAGAAPLTTDAIANYLKNVPQNEAKQVLDALVVDNPELQEAIEDAIEEYLTTPAGYAVAFQIALYYMDQYLTPDEAKDYYNALKANTNVTAKIKELVKAFVMDENNRDKVKGWVKPVVLYCLDNTTLQDAKDVYHALQDIPASEKQEIKQVVKNYVDLYVQSDDFKELISNNQAAIVAEINDVVASISKDEALAAWGWLGMTNPDATGVKTVMRTRLNHYIDKYVTNELNDELDDSVDPDNFVMNPSCTINYCDLEGLFNAWATQHPVQQQQVGD